MRLTNLTIGEKAIIQKISGNQDMVHYLETKGLKEGTTLTVSFGNTTEKINIKTNNELLTISKSFAANIDVKRCM